MKKLLFTLLLGITSLAYSQAPQKISYQGVARNTSGTVLANQPIGLKFVITDGSTSIYSEIQPPITTNSFGLFSAFIGGGTPTFGTFSSINWSTGTYFLEVLIDPAGGTSYTSVGTQQFMSVPYALNAGSAPAPAVSFTNNILSVGGNTTTIPSGMTYTAGSGIGFIGTGVITSTANIIGTGATNVTGTYPNLTINTPTTQVYSAGNGIDINGTGVITGTANIVGTGATSVTGTYPNLTINTPTTQVYTAGNGIDITAAGVISNILTPITPTITSTGIAVVTPTTGNNFNVSVPQPTLSYNNATNVLSLTHDGTTVSTATLVGTGTNTTSIVGTGLATVTPTTGSTFTVSVPNPTLSVGSGSISISGGNSVPIPTTSIVAGNTNIQVVPGLPGTNSYTLNAYTYSLSNTSNTLTLTNGAPFGYTSTVVVPTQSLSVGSGSISISGGNSVPIPTTSVVSTNTNISVTSSAGVYSLTAVSSPSTTLVAGTNVSLTPVGNTYTVSTPSYSISSGTGSISITNGVSTSTAPIVVPILSYTATATAGTLQSGAQTVTIPNYTLSNTSNTITLNNGTANSTAIIPVPTLTLTGGSILQSGPATNTVDIKSINNWSVTTGVIYPSTLTNSVGVGISSSLGGRLGISHTSSPASPHINLISPTTSDFGRVKFLNSGSSRYFSFEARNNTGGAADAFNIAHNNGIDEKQVFLINGNRNVFINNLNLPLASFHVMTSVATATGGIATEGFGEAGQLNIIRNENSSGIGNRTQVVGLLEIGKINFSAYDGSAYGNGAKIYARTTESVTTTNKGTELIFASVPTGTFAIKDAFKINGTGNLEVISGLQIPFSAGAGKVLTSDATGNASWQAAPTSTNNWSVNGNAGTNAVNNFIGTTDNLVLNFRVNNQRSAQIDGNLQNTSFGYEAAINSTGNNYAAFGHHALFANTSGALNAAFGHNALASNTNGSQNTGIGTQALATNINGNNNTAVGYQSLSSATGSSNTAIGYLAGQGNIVGNGNVFIGHRAGVSETTSNKLHIANTGTTTLIYGDFSTKKIGLNTTTPVGFLEVLATNTTDPTIRMFNSTANVNWDFLIASTSVASDPKSLTIKSSSNASDFGISPSTAFPDAFTIKGNSGKVGINNVAPSAQLDVINSSASAEGLLVSNNTTNNGIRVVQNGTGNGIFAGIYNSSSSAKAIEAQTNGTGSTLGSSNTGSGSAGSFAINNATNTAAAVYVSTNGTGNAIYAANNSSTAATADFANSSADVVRAISSGGLGRALVASSNSNGTSAVDITNTGTGSALGAYKNSGSTGGNVANFANNSNLNGDDVLRVHNSGTAAAIHASNNAVDPASALTLWVENGHIRASGGSLASPTVASGGGIVLPSASLTTKSNDVSGSISIAVPLSVSLTGSPFIDVSISYNKQYPTGNNPLVQVTPLTDLLGLQYYISASSNSGFTLRIYRPAGFTTPGTIALTTFKFNYFVMEE